MNLPTLSFSCLLCITWYFLFLIDQLKETHFTNTHPLHYVRQKTNFNMDLSNLNNFSIYCSSCFLLWDPNYFYCFGLTVNILAPELLKSSLLPHLLTLANKATLSKPKEKTIAQIVKTYEQSVAMERYT